jgi:hypothetical protein
VTVLALGGRPRAAAEPKPAPLVALGDARFDPAAALLLVVAPSRFEGL